MDVEGDRLSGLQDDLILKILSFVGLKDAIGTSVMSPRWRYLWTSIPHLRFSSEDFPNMEMFSNFVTHVLSRRNTQAQLSSVKLYVSGAAAPRVTQMIMNHAFYHNVQQLNVTCLFGDITDLFKQNSGASLSVSSAQTLKHFTLSTYSILNHHITLTSTRELSSLTTLQLDQITLDDGFFSKCPNLENLTLKCCEMIGSTVLSIYHPRVSNLSIEGTINVKVVAPRLKNLTISQHVGGFQISAPELASLLFKGLAPSMFSTDGFHSLEKAQLSMHGIRSEHAPIIISLLQKFHNVKDLSLSMEIIQMLNSSLELISRQPSPLANLNTLKLLPRIHRLLVWHRHDKRVVMSTEVKNYLLSSAPEATLIETRVSARAPLYLPGYIEERLSPILPSPDLINSLL